MRGAEGGKLMDVWGVEAGLCCWPNMIPQNSSNLFYLLFRFILFYFILFYFILFYFMLCYFC